MTNTSDINPKHYELVIKGHKIEVADIMEARFADDAHLAQAIKYLLRAGRKSSASYISDVGKCLWWCAKAIMYHGGTHIELPTGKHYTAVADTRGKASSKAKRVSKGK